MSNGKLLLVPCMVVVTTLLFSGCSTLGTQPRIRADVVMKQGEELWLFYGGTEEAKAVFCPGETVTVYRAYPQKRLRYLEVGTVKILRVIDRQYLAAEVLSGSVKDGDIAMKANASCLVRPPGLQE